MPRRPLSVWYAVGHEPWCLVLAPMPDGTAMVVAMISPYVRRLRLGAELRAMRVAAGLTHVQVGRKIGVSRVKVSRLENGHQVDLRDEDAGRVRGGG